MKKSTKIYAGAASGLVLAVLGMGGELARANVEGPIASLAGRWAGTGSVTPASGRKEAFKCVVTYFPNADASRIDQNLRCHSDNYKLEAATHLTIRGKEVSGRWEDKLNAFTGAVTGSVTPDGFDIHLSGQFFKAQMTVVSSQCEQSVTVVPVKADYIRELSAALKRC